MSDRLDTPNATTLEAMNDAELDEREAKDEGDAAQEVVGDEPIDASLDDDTSYDRVNPPDNAEDDGHSHA